MTPYGRRADRYHCLLDEQPYYLTPSRLLRSLGSDELKVNSLCSFSWQHPQTRNLSTPLLSNEIPNTEAVIWVPDAATGAVWPYWVGPEYVAFLAFQEPGYPVSVKLPQHAKWVLFNADILVPRNHVARKQCEWRHYQTFRAADFRRGFAVVPNLIPPFHLGALRRYARQKVRTGVIPLIGGRFDGNRLANSEPIARYMQQQFARALSDIVGVVLRPSDALFVACGSGSSVQYRTNRADRGCAVTLLIDSTPEPREQSPWPLKLDLPQGSVAVWQYLGEALVDRGRHRRDPLPSGWSSTSLSLNYLA